jgi:hypothetical protein
MTSLKAAYESVGYTLLREGQMKPHWSAEKPDGICISLWASELKGKTKLDTLIDSDVSKCDSKLNRIRIEHLKRAKQSYHGLVDVIILNGIPGNSKPKPDDRKWKVTFLDEVTGDFAVEVVQEVPENA